MTIQSVIQAAAIKAATQLIKSKATRKTENLGSEKTFMSAHLFKHWPSESFPDDVSKISSLFWPMGDQFDVSDCADKDFWQLAKQVFDSNRKLLETSLKHWSVSFAIMSEVMPEVMGSLNGKRVALLGFTNHGDCSWVNGNTTNGNSINVGAILTKVHQSRPVIGPVFGNFVTTINDRCFWCVNYSNDVIDEAGAREQLRQSVRILVEACDPTGRVTTVTEIAS